MAEVPRATKLAWDAVLHLDHERKVAGGDAGTLLEAVRRGADLRIYTEFRHNEHVDTASMRDALVKEVSDFPITYVVEDRWCAGVMSLRQPIQVPDGFGLSPSLSFFLYNQDGQQAIARPYLDGVPRGRQPTGKAAVTPDPQMPKYHRRDSWDEGTNAPSENFVYNFERYVFRVCDRWREVYAHDAQGRPTSGSLDELVDAFSEGCEVKVAVRGLCDDFEEGAADHEVFVQQGSCYYYTDSRQFLACSRPLVRVAPSVPMRYRSRGWDFGWIMPRTDGFVAQTLYDPYTLMPRKRSGRYALRWFIDG